MDASDSASGRLGELLVGSGSLTEEQLEDALLEQRVTHKRLGSILVSRGTVTAPELTAGLVAQIGGETGSAAAFPAESPDEHQPTNKKARRSVASRVFPSGRRRARAEAEAELLSQRSAAETHLSDLTRRLEQAGRELEQARVGITARDTRLAEVESRLQASEQERVRLLDVLRAEIRLQDSALQAVQRLESAVGNGRSYTEPESPATGTEGYLALAPRPSGGHALLELDGRPPAIGSEIQLGDKRFVVSSHGPAPQASDPRVCVRLKA